MRAVCNVALLETIGRDGLPYLMLFTTAPIPAGNELLLDYGAAYWLYHKTELKRLKALAVSCLCSLDAGQLGVPASQPFRVD